MSEQGTRAPLRRSRSDRVIAGVAGGIARHLGVDSTLLRIGWVALTLAGPGVLLYLIAWIVIAEEETGAPVERRTATSDEGLRLILGGVLISIGVLLLLHQVIPTLSKFLLPMTLIVVGVGVLIGASRR